MRGPFPAAMAVLLLASGLASADIGDYLLPNGEPIVGVYYYSWFAGEPYRHVGWTPEFEYDNRNNDAHIYEVIKAMTDHGINQASYSYWDNGWYLDGLERHLNHAQTLLGQGRPCYFSPYLEPNTVNKVFADPAAQRENTEFISTYTKAFGSHDAFCRLGGDPFTNIYVTYYVPDETDEDFRAFLKEKYGTYDDLVRAWTAQEGYEGQMLPRDRLPEGIEGITLGLAREGTVAFADRQALRAQRLKSGWGKVVEGVKAQTGMDTRYTGDVSSTNVSPVDYMQGLTGMSWYSFGYPLTNPTRRPKLISEVGKFTDTAFLYTISPGYVDRQQRWEGGRVEREPFLYPYAWVKAIQTLPEGVMILTHSEWFEGSIIDVTKEYGRQEYETTELYSSVFRGAFESLYREKRDTEPIAIVFNEWVTYGLHPEGQDLRDVSGLIKLLECLNLEYDVIPESMLSAERLQGRKLVLVPNCGVSLAPGRNELLLDWARNSAGVTLLVDASAWWAKALGMEFADEPAFIARYRCENQGPWVTPLSERQDGMRITDAGVCTVVGESEGDVPKILGRQYRDGGRGVVFFNGRLGGEFGEAFDQEIRKGTVPTMRCSALKGLLEAIAPEVMATTDPPPCEEFEIKAGPVLEDGATALLPAGNVIPWGYITNHKTTGWGLEEGYSAEDAHPWKRLRCSFRVAVPDEEPVAEVCALDSDSGRFTDLAFRRENGAVAFEHDMKFHAVFAVVKGPVKLLTPALSISPGQTRTLPCQAVNVTGTAADCRLKLRRTPGMSMAPVAFSAPAGGVARFDLQLSAGTDYATGNRTLVFELESGGRTAAVWRPMICTLPACIGARTTVVGGPAGAQVTREIAVVNVGEAPAENVRLSFLGATAAVSDLAPGQEATARITFSVPRPARMEHIPEGEVSLTLGAEKASRGLSTRSGGDGTWEDLVLGGRPATAPIRQELREGAAANRMIYLYVDDAVMPPGDYDVQAQIDYFDRGTGSFMLEYDATPGDGIEDRYRDSTAVPLTDSGSWRTVTLPLPGARFGGRQNNGADLRVNGLVAVGRIALRGLAVQQTRKTVPMTVSYTQFGNAMEQELPLTVVSLPQDAGTAPALNPYSPAPETPLWQVQEPAGLKVTDLLRQQGLLVIENPYLSAVWDARRGGLASLYSKITRADYAAFPGPALPVMYQPAEGPGGYFAPTDLSYSDGRVTTSHQPVPGLSGSVEVQDTWTVFPDEPHIRLERYVTPRSKLRLADFAPAVLRLSPEALDQVMPLGVGFQGDGAPKRGWLETWHSEGWYFAYSGDPNRAGHGVAMCVQAEPIAGRTGLSRFRYGFFPAGGLPAPPGATASADELQIRLRGHRSLEPTDRIHLTIDLYLLPQGSYQTARQLALRLATPADITSAAAGKDWSAVQGVQTIRPTAPLYMFPVRAPYYSAALEGDR